MSSTTDENNHNSSENVDQNDEASLKQMQEQALVLQTSLADILEEIQTVKDETQRLNSENKFLQDYIGNLLSTGNLINK